MPDIFGIRKSATMMSKGLDARFQVPHRHPSRAPGVYASFLNRLRAAQEDRLFIVHKHDSGQ